MALTRQTLGQSMPAAGLVGLAAAVARECPDDADGEASGDGVEAEEERAGEDERLGCVHQSPQRSR